jgi:hypothetical protein
MHASLNNVNISYFVMFFVYVIVVMCLCFTVHTHSPFHRLTFHKHVVNGNSDLSIIGKCRLVGDHLLLRDFGPYGIIFMMFMLL